MAEKRITYKIQDLGGIGEVQIADEVVAIIAGPVSYTHLTLPTIA